MSIKTKNVIKRNGKTVSFDAKKIFAAIEGANKDIEKSLSKSEISQATLNVVVKIDAQHRDPISVEDIQDIVESVLMDMGYQSLAKEYIRYRHLHEMRRNASQKLMESYNELLFADSKDMDLKRDNANVNGDAPMGIMLKLGTEGAKTFADNYAIPEEFVEADKAGILHYHDKDFSLITFNCCQIDIGKLFKGGFSTGHGHLREPNSIRAAASLACIAVQSNQNSMFGGQSINALDFALAPYVKKSFDKAFRSNLEKLMSLFCDKQEVLDDLKYQNFDAAYDHCYSAKIAEQINQWLLKHNIVCNYPLKGIAATAWENACRDVEEETKQAMEAMIHNFNTLHSRAGAQTPFSSINYGLDTSPEGRLIIDKTLDAIYDGLGNGETPIFPISVFQIKDGVNYRDGDPNVDLFRKACKVSAKRLYPNFVNIDAPYNLQYYKPDDYNSTVATMGCRTRVMSNVNGPEESGSRGNFAFATINLPMLALMAEGNQDKFFKLLDKYSDTARRYLTWRYNIIAHKKAKNFPFLMSEGVWMDGEKLGPEDEIGEVLKHASISIGFCGLAECLVALVGKHHGESKEAQELGLKIVGRLRELTDEYTKKYHMNWSTFATPKHLWATASKYAA